MTMQPCRLCDAVTTEIFRQRVLRRHDVGYHRCPRCGLIQTDAPFWLDEAYSEALSALDVGAIQRNELCRRLTTIVAAVFGITRNTRCLDYGGGYGVFSRMMRDSGFDFRWSDRYANNLCAG